MAIAIFHNFLDNIGGAEIVTLLLARELGADVYTTNIDQEKIKKMGFSDLNIYSIGWVPAAAPLRQELTYWRFRFLNLGKRYNFYIISGDWAMAAAVNYQPNFWYVYSPMREVWDLASYVREQLVPWYGHWVFNLWLKYRRHFIFKHLKSVNHLVAISNNVKNRIEKYLNRTAAVVYPPVEVNKFYYRQSGGYWLSVNRLVVHKRVLMQLEAFKRLPDEKLVIIGSYEKSKHFKQYAKLVWQNKPKNVEILSWVGQERLIELYANCKGFITTSLDEDFGLNVIEAMAAGKPVIAPNDGGYRETVIDGATGRLIDSITSDKLVLAIKDLGQNPVQFKAVCQKQAQNFDLAVFIKKIKEQIKNDYQP
ncbi:MAG: hypothetical protein A2729_05110 [Candidatus Buchananbacteria bacterium RIFCSPHIGHO2_01_FULL_39_14]|uniref:Glycosyl transferase family 1 domain-containing protein n=2 Tax=Candidatus Buchananiibacteriota TaxID=1817903 RepID=A0A1G1YRX1_9BACT|nr:MAG: hypothetical protein A2729_05110 [Candidatus Buchananbacteria bacterium RIFCSPHIGHO2_01_FULL_39_14]OGY49123.1 MAG: hypothetical protein A3D39_01730 [Candidatus Buchananbacteria bacterium RIFCSPHIGHO2_02_FULL_39_17]OGY55093.1 MAG: hypothetical protein A2912_00065 [Candidatus Buchananbacteria bacterium RIFCSPLOWO2_01_FULL_40_23b]